MRHIDTSFQVSLPGPYMAEQIGWRWYYWIFVILGSAIFIGLFFLVPETRFDRPAAYIDGQIIAYDAFGNPRILSDEEATEELAAGRVASDGGLATALHDEKFTFLQRINPFTRPVKDPLRVYLGVWRDMAICLLDPGCLYALGLGSIILGGVVAMSTSIASVLEDDYGWPSANTSLYIIGSTISGFLVIPFGMACDKLCLWLSKRNGGQHLPEHRVSRRPDPFETVGLARALIILQTRQSASRLHISGDPGHCLQPVIRLLLSEHRQVQLVCDCLLLQRPIPRPLGSHRADGHLVSILLQRRPRRIGERAKGSSTGTVHRSLHADV